MTSADNQPGDEQELPAAVEPVPVQNDVTDVRSGEVGQAPVGIRADVTTAAEDLPIEQKLLANAIGGWRGMIDSALPAVVFLIVYPVSGQVLSIALWSAIGTAAALTVLRLIRRQPLTQVAGGFAGVALSAFVASRTGTAEGYFLPGLITNAAYGLGALVSVLVSWPIMGVFIGAMTGSVSAWRSDAPVRRAMASATWIWVAVFWGRLLVQLPLYFLGYVTALGTAKIVLGWPLFLLGAWLNYRLIKPIMPRLKELAESATQQAEQAAAHEEKD